MSLETETLDALKRARDAARALALCPSAQKNQALGALAAMLREERGAILGANADDLERARASGMSGAFVERLTLNDARIEVAPLGRIFIRNIAMAFDAYLSKTEARKQTFSKTL